MYRSFHRTTMTRYSTASCISEHKYEIAHATVQMEYQPCSGPECHLNTMHAGHDHHHHH
nr:Zinc transporter zitB [Klebsiella pneumoniae]